MHFGLASAIYTHFTSPIRRYADCVVHRLLAASLGEISFQNTCHAWLILLTRSSLCPALLPSHASSSGIEALPDELRESRRVQRIANVLNRKHRAAQYVAAPAPSSCWSPSQRLHPADTPAAPPVTSSLFLTASLSLLFASTHARCWQICSPVLLGQTVRRSQQHCVV